MTPSWCHYLGTNQPPNFLCSDPVLTKLRLKPTCQPMRKVCPQREQGLGQENTQASGQTTLALWAVSPEKWTRPEGWASQVSEVS